MSLLLPTSYFPPVSYFSALLKNKNIIIEVKEHFPKQTWRNRCSIYSPNGQQHLIIPLSNRRDKTIVEEIIIDNNQNWQSIHFKSLEAAYRSSPFFEFYEDDLRHLFEIKNETLLQHNLQCLKAILKITGIECNITLSTEYNKTPAGLDDQREILSKKNISNFVNPPYYQTFSNKNGFLNNLSILDLLFNKGRETSDYLYSIV